VSGQGPGQKAAQSPAGRPGIIKSPDVTAKEGGEKKSGSAITGAIGQHLKEEASSHPPEDDDDAENNSSSSSGSGGSEPGKIESTTEIRWLRVDIGLQLDSSGSASDTAGNGGGGGDSSSPLKPPRHRHCPTGGDTGRPDDAMPPLSPGVCESYSLSLPSSGFGVLASPTYWGALKGLETFVQLFDHPMHAVRRNVTAGVDKDVAVAAAAAGGVSAAGGVVTEKKTKKKKKKDGGAHHHHHHHLHHVPFYHKHADGQTSFLDEGDGHHNEPQEVKDKEKENAEAIAKAKAKEAEEAAEKADEPSSGTSTDLIPALSAYPVTIEDWPRFPWRGFLIDTARHFLPVALMLRHLDAMAASKLNVLHWHLTDWQSFPFASEKLPRLAEAGALGRPRPAAAPAPAAAGTTSGGGSNMKPPLPATGAAATNSAGHDKPDGSSSSSSSGNVYSFKDLRTVATRAYALGISIVVELDVPAHR
jgi:hypothetical protein